jgi:hypothetical protein
MNGNGITSNFKRLPKPWAALLHVALLGSSLALFLGRNPGPFRSEAIVMQVPDFYLHASNASISLLLYAGVGYFWLMLGVSMKPVALAGAAVIASNFVYELFLPFLNTADIIDAWYGVAGVVCGFVELWIIDWRGMMLSPAAGQPV